MGSINAENAFVSVYKKLQIGSHNILYQETNKIQIENYLKIWGKHLSLHS